MRHPHYLSHCFEQSSSDFSFTIISSTLFTMASDKRQAASGAMMSNVGNPQVYEDGDQRCVYLRSSSVCSAERLTVV